MVIAHARNLILFVLAGSLVLSGCGDDEKKSDDSSSSRGTIPVSGSVFAAPVKGASCEVKNSSGTTLAKVTTDANGGYTANVPVSALSADLMVVCSGGTYTNEADGSKQTAGTLAAYVAAGMINAGSSIHVTPESTIVQRMVTNHGLSPVAALNAFNTAFGYMPDIAVAPANATSPASGATMEQKLAGLRAAAFSQLTKDIGLTPGQQFALLDAIASDLSDGTLDGASGVTGITIAGTAKSLPADVQNRFANAMINFRAGGNDATTLTNAQIGILPFGRVAFTSSYKIEYIPGVAGAMQGQTRFQLRVSYRSNGLPVVDESVILTPEMNMAADRHATPQTGCSATATPGTYDCTVYYMMASDISDVTSMGYWDLAVMIGGIASEMTHFYPKVMMGAGSDSVRVTLKSGNDQITSMTMGTTELRSYYLFKSALTAGIGGTYTFQLFIAAKESMMSYPAVTSTAVLSPGDAHELPITSMSVEFSTNGTTWLPASDVGNGYWQAAGLTGLSSGVQGTVHVRMSINGVRYTTSGDMASGSEGHAVFTVTPGAI